MIRETVHALAACVVSFVLCAVAYPAAAWALGQLLFPEQAEGSLIYRGDRTVIGSELIGQPFAADGYFHPRPSAAGANGYAADAASGSNLGTKNPALRKTIAERAEALKATPENPAPADLVTASGGGLDPHISPESARYQVARVAARRLPVDRVRTLIDEHTERSGAIIGAPPRVNVLKLNRVLDEEKPAPELTPAESAETAPGPKAEVAKPDLAGDLAALRTDIGSLAGQLGQLGKQIEASRDDKTGAGLKDLEVRVAALSENTARAAALTEQVGRIDERVRTAGETLQQLRSELDETRAALKQRGSARPVPGRRP